LLRIIFLMFGSTKNLPSRRTALLAVAMALLTALLLTRGRPPQDLFSGLALAAVLLFLNAMFILMLHTGQTDRWRAPIFISYAACFAFSFVGRLIESRHAMSLTHETLLTGGIPFCPIAIPMTLIPAVCKKVIIFPGSLLGPLSVGSMFVLWLGASLTLGRGWCGWGCFFGGMDDGFSRLLKRPLIRRISACWTDLPFAVLFLAVTTSAWTFFPTYCAWACPFRTVTELNAVASANDLVQNGIYVTLFLAFVVTLPILLKRRAQCSLLCPFGAFQSGANWINPFEVRIDTEACSGCGLCVDSCPTVSMTAQTLVQGRSGASCTKCGRCVDVCPEKAACFHVKGTGPHSDRELARLMFIFPAFLFLAAMSGGFYLDAVAKLLRLAFAGRTN
jgi:ferredoxin